MTTLPDRLTAERDAAFAASRCQCATDEACRELAKLHAEVAKLRDTCGTGAGCLHKDATIDCLRDQLHLAEVVRASQVEGLTQGAAGWRERANQLEAEVAGLREDAERYRALKERHGYIMVVRLINADGYSSAKKDALIDAFADAAIADIAAWEALSEAQKALQLDAQAKRAEINAARKGTTPTTPPPSPSPRS